MKNLKTLLIPVALIALVVGIVSFTNHEGENDEKCKIKIVKIVNGEETVIDSTFDCPEDGNWMESMHGLGKVFHKMIMIDGDSNNIDFKFDFDFDESDEHGMKVMKFKGGDGEEVEMKFDFEINEGEEGKDGVMKMMINGETMEIKVGDIHKHLEKMHGDMEFIHKTGNVEILIDSDEEGGESHTVKMTKNIDDDGNVTIKKIVNGEEVEIDENEIHDMHKGHKMMFIGEDGKMEGNHEVTIDVKVDGEDGEEMKHVVIITKMSGDDKSAKRVSKTVDLNKKELSINKLKFSPNPNDGKFDLSFKLNKEKPVQIKIVDIHGKTVYSEKVNDFAGKYNNNIDISKNGKGIYILQITQDNKASTSKVVIK